MRYEQWLRGSDCCCGSNNSTISNDCGSGCSCQEIYLEINNNKVDLIALSGDVEYALDELDEKQDILSAGTGIEITENNVINCTVSRTTDLSDYYTKEEVDLLIPTEVSELTNDSGYINQLKTINGESLIGEGNIQIGGGGTIDAYTKEEADNRFVLKSDLSGYAETSTLIQYISNLQQQITSLQSTISGCCAETGETLYRWITETGENDYWCDGTTKKTKEKQQSSTDGLTWTDTGIERSGSTVLEENCVDCGYVPVVSNKLTVNYINGETISKECDGSTVLRNQNFSNWENISGATVGDCITEIGDLAFNGFSGLTSISLPNTITKIGGLAFSHCIALPSINIPSGVTEIGNQAFNYCYSLQSVILPSGVTNVPYSAFYYSSGLTSVTLSNATQKIGVQAFGKCAFGNITIPSTLTEIGEYAFSYNPNLTNVTVYATIPPTLVDDNGNAGNVQRNIFIGCNNLSAIYVPSASVETYKTANGWSAYANIIQGI